MKSEDDGGVPTSCGEAPVRLKTKLELDSSGSETGLRGSGPRSVPGQRSRGRCLPLGVVCSSFFFRSGFCQGKVTWTTACLSQSPNPTRIKETQKNKVHEATQPEQSHRDGRTRRWGNMKRKVQQCESHIAFSRHHLDTHTRKHASLTTLP